MVPKPTHGIQCGECANASHRKITWAQVLPGIMGLVNSQGRRSVWGPLVSFLPFCLCAAGLRLCLCLGSCSGAQVSPRSVWIGLPHWCHPIGCGHGGGATRDLRLPKTLFPLQWGLWLGTISKKTGQEDSDRLTWYTLLLEGSLRGQGKIQPSMGSSRRGGAGEGSCRSEAERQNGPLG